MFCVIMAFMVLIGRLFYLQVIEGERYRLLAENNCIRLQTISAPRGLIFDRNGELLAENRPSFTLSIVPRDAHPVEETLERLSFYTGIEIAELRETFDAGRGADYKPVVLRRDINRDMVAVVESHRYDLPGVMIDTKIRRYYVHHTSAHVIGYLSEINSEELRREDALDRRREAPGRYRPGDMIGKFGIEKRFEGYLRGKLGGRQVEVNARGQVVRVLGVDAAQPGDNIYLTLDLHLQQAAEALLAGKVGGVVVLNAENGEILALASSPTFDPNDFVDGMSHQEWNALINDPHRPIRNKVIQGKYPPASTYKIVTAIAGLEEGAINEATSVYCPGHYRFGDRVFRCWRRGGHGRVSVVDALKVSCDVFFYQVGQKVGVDRLAYYAKACGLGSPTGIALGHEADGLIPTSQWKRASKGVPWQKGETLSVAIGQGYNLVTPLQMGVLTAAVANGGTLLRPLLVRKIVSPDGGLRIAPRKEVRGRLPVSPETLAIVREGLWEVVNGSRGTARRAKVEGVDVSGKTGTAQVVSRTKNEAAYLRKSRLFKPHAWFVAIGEYQGDRIAVSVIVEHGEAGSGTAAPIAKDLIQAYFYHKYEELAEGPRDGVKMYPSG